LRRRRGEEGVFTCAEEGLELAALEEAVAVLGEGGAAGVVGDRGHGVGRKQSRAPGGLVAAEWSEVEWTPPAGYGLKSWLVLGVVGLGVGFCGPGVYKEGFGPGSYTDRAGTFSTPTRVRLPNQLAAGSGNNVRCLKKKRV
jgi:hypothetical protein